jgi:hypothetical protein
MRKLSKNEKNKVPKISEAEYAAYVAALKNGEIPKKQGGMYEFTRKTPPLEKKETTL